MKSFLVWLLFFFSVLSTWGQDYDVNSWQEIKNAKKGKVVVLYNSTVAFTQNKVDGSVGGIDYELLTAFFNFVEQRYKVQIDVNWSEVDAFNKIYNGVLRSKSGTFGAGSISITPKRMKEIGFSPAYMPDIEILTSSQNLPIAKSLAEFQEIFDTLTILNIPQTTFEENVKSLRSNYLPNTKIENIQNIGALIKTITQKDNYFGYVHLPIYVLALRDGIPTKRQKFFQVTRQGYAFIFPKQSDWLEPVNAFFASQEYKGIIERILTESLGSQIIDLLAEISQENKGDAQLNVHSSGEIALLTKEKE